MVQNKTAKRSAKNHLACIRLLLLAGGVCNIRRIRTSLLSKSICMLQNYFKTTWRNLRTHKAYAAINIAGLAIGIAASFIIYVVIHYELSIDAERNHREGDPGPLLCD